MAFVPINALAAQPATPGEQAKAQRPAAPMPKAKPKAPANSKFQTPNPKTNAGSVPRPSGQGERQLDGSRTQTMTQPQKKPGLASREPAPARSSGGSGLEAAMAAEADRLHPPKRRG